jgi:2,4-dienoyl-CoA reductase-like NADH-dependent reductase (Old Yellow Enzyme family)
MKSPACLPLSTPLSLPNGAVVPNRVAKAAMEESLADAGQLPGPALRALYAAWARGGAGLILTGNVMVDGRALTGPGGVVLERDTALGPFAAWARDARAHGAQVWMQMVGVATAMSLRPDLPSAWFAGRDIDVPVQAVAWKDKGLAGLAGMALVKRRLRAVAAGRREPRAYSPLFTLIVDQLRTKRLAGRYRRWAGR